jgi:hypothetical protein
VCSWVIVFLWLMHKAALRTLGVMMASTANLDTWTQEEVE